MKKIIMLKYAELNTKKDNIGMFLKSLKRNLEDKLSNYNTIITFDICVDMNINFVIFFFGY